MLLIGSNNIGLHNLFVNEYDGTVIIVKLCVLFEKANVLEAIKKSIISKLESLKDPQIKS